MKGLGVMTDQNILVSVVIPTYSRNESLSRAIDSVLNQTYQNFEIIVVDDNPVNSDWRALTEILMDKYINNPKVRYVKNEKNLGGAGARNEGIKAAYGEYIAFLDDDDEYFSERIEKQIECFLNSDSEKLALVFCDALMTGNNEEFICYLKPRYKGNCLYEAMKDNCLAPTSQWMAKKSALIDVGLFSIVPSKQDATLILKLLSQGYEVDNVPEVLSKFRNCDDSGRITCSGIKNIEGELLYRKKCRRLYSCLNNKQIKEVEYTFNSVLHDLYNANRIRQGKQFYMIRMLKAFPARTVLKLTYNQLLSLKWKIKRRYKLY